MPLTSPGNDDDTGENHQPTLRKNTAEPVEQTLKQNTADVVRVRKGIIDSGLAYSPERGLLAFTVPGMGDFIRRAALSEEQTYDDRA